MRSVILPIAVLLGACRTERPPVDQLPAPMTPTSDVQPTAVGIASANVVERQEFLHDDVWYDDVFGHYVDDGVKLEVVSCSAEELVLDVSALAKRPRPRPPESGVAVRLTLTRDRSEVRASGRSRWWSDVRRTNVNSNDGSVSQRPWKGETDATTLLVVLAPGQKDLTGRFTVNTVWSGSTAVVSGGFWLSHEHVAQFLDAWNAARAAQER
ncbi:MAG: hypothetical protein IT459_14345 [Planctomycetes bacterium]|nr:hypothetical protein [Planctomycetota bacterium]